MLGGSRSNVMFGESRSRSCFEGEDQGHVGREKEKGHLVEWVVGGGIGKLADVRSCKEKKGHGYKK